MKNLARIFSSSYPYYLNDNRRNTVMIVGVCVFLVVFVVTFHPRHFHQLPKITLISGVTFAVLFACIILLPRVAPALFDTFNWTLGRHLLFTLLQLIAIALAVSAVLHVLDFYPQLTFPGVLFHVLPDVFIYGVIPITFVTLLMRNRMLKENLDHAVTGNRELERIRLLKEQIAGNDNVITIFSDTSETLKLNLPDLLFVEASGNYSTFYWRSGESIGKKMLRMNLKRVESQLNNAFTVRCHHSYIVNIYAVGTLTGNTNGYRLSIPKSDYTIPVSRAKGKDVLEKIEQIRSVMELR